MVARNAWFNIARLKTKAVKYYVNFYGAMADSINAGDDSDRILVEWDLINERVIKPSPNQISVEIPKDIVEIRKSDIESARNWRRQVRDALKQKLDAGWSIIDFTKDYKYILSEEK